MVFAPKKKKSRPAVHIDFLGRVAGFQSIFCFSPSTQSTMLKQISRATIFSVPTVLFQHANSSLFFGIAHLIPLDVSCQIWLVTLFYDREIRL